MKYAVEMGSGAMIFMKIDSGILKFIGGYIHVDTETCRH
jgi:hypothetical protein